MVATLLSLRWRITVHQFRRDWWRLLFVLAGGIWSLSIVPLLVIGSSHLATEAYDVKRDALVALGGVIAIAWIVVPLLATGVDDSLEPARFAPWGIEVRRLMPGLAVAAFTTVPALFFVAVAIVGGFTWRGEHSSAALAVGLAGALLSSISWVFAARLAALWGGRLLAARWGKAAIGAIVAALIASMVAAANVVRADGLERVLDTDLLVLLRAWGRTPLGAGFAAPSSLVVDDPAGAWWRLAMMLGWVVLLYLAWRDAVSHALVNPVARGGGAHRVSDAMLATAARTREAGPTSVLRHRATAVVRARVARSWRTDPRHLAQLIGALLFPTIGGGMAVVVAGGAGAWITALPVALALGIGWGRHNDLAYDSSAVWLDIVSGVPGRRVMAGRVLATAQWAVPAVVAASVATALVAHRWDAALPVTAASVGVLLAALGVASITSVLLPYRVPAPGESPFGADAGSIGASLVGQLVSSAGTGLVVPLVAGPLAAAFVWGGAWWPASVVVGLVVGPAIALAAVAASGSLYDSRSGRLIGAIA